MGTVKHVLGISGGKDSAALALYLKDRHPDLDIEYYTCDTGRELQETYDLIDRLEGYLGKKILKLHSVDLNNTMGESPFDHFLQLYGGYLPSSNARWCTKKLKLDPFEKYLGDLPTISYVGIRGDEDREGYISKRKNVQSIFPFRKNIWSEDVITYVLNASGINRTLEIAKSQGFDKQMLDLLGAPLGQGYSMNQKLNRILDFDVKAFNKLVFQCLKGSPYPVGMLDSFALIDNDEVLGIDDIFSILRGSGVGVPAYYEPLEYEVEIDGEIHKGVYNRSRSGCFFCFFQQKIEWIWLFERHPELFAKAMEYEKDGYTWMDSERLEELCLPRRVKEIKLDHYKRSKSLSSFKNWKDLVLESEGVGCASCFI
ncbi:MAG: phosphoadenosine phosphosulfate reductase family protein [Flavobacteriales bacterium]|nr:phosphoadenosine phosphosulfate reductase family protein [Flavobacteriales bacterium]